MSTLRAELHAPSILHATVTDETLTVELADGRVISVPLAWYPRLVHATHGERDNWRLIGHGEGLHWPDLDEDISAENIVFGQPSGESQQSLMRWLGGRGLTGFSNQDERPATSFFYRRRKDGDTWHFCSNCSNWPASNYIQQPVKPPSGEFCNECRSKQANSNCR